MRGGGLESALEQLVERLGFELVAVERGGSSRRPLLRVRIDRPGSGDSGITVEDCARVSRAVSGLLEEAPEAPGEYILEVSSPGVERPLVRPRDYRRFAGREVTLRGYAPLLGRSRRLSGVLLGLEEETDSIAVRVGDERVEVPLAAIAKANLVYRAEGRTEKR
ncbi:MAG: ribosome maturation factor RimP [Gemmatimonadota bacterium]